MSYEKGIAEQLRRVANVYDLEVTFQDRSFQPTSTSKVVVEVESYSR